MRISDWSSDVCSSDLAVIGGIEQANHDQGDRPGDELRENLAARAPDHRAAHAVAECGCAFLRLCATLEFRAFAHHIILPGRGFSDTPNILCNTIAKRVLTRIRDKPRGLFTDRGAALTATLQPATNKYVQMSPARHSVPPQLTP